jgi:hypothetical protein
MTAPSSFLNIAWMASVLIACQSEKAPSTGDNSSTHWSFFGDSISDFGHRISTQEAFDLLNKTGSAAGLFESVIVQSCLDMGCWMSVKGPHDDSVMVFMKDHAFFLPKESLEGKTVYFLGEAFYDTVSVDLQKHLLKDAGATEEEINAVSAPSFELAFQASGVMIADIPTVAINSIEND